MSVCKKQLVADRQAGPFPDDVKEALKQHKAELMIALGIPIDRTVASILKELRPHLPPALRQLPDDRLLALVNSWIIAVSKTAIQKVMR